MSMVRDMGIACGEDSKRTFQGWSMVIITRRKTTKMETLFLKTTIYSRIQCCQPCHMPYDIRGLASLTSCNQVHLTNSVHQGKVTKWKWYPCNGFCISLLSVLIFSWSLLLSLGIKHEPVRFFHLDKSVHNFHRSQNILFDSCSMEGTVTKGDLR